MTRLPRVLLFTVAAVAALVSCSDGSNKTSLDDIDNATVAPGVTFPAGVDVPGLTDECEQVYVQFITAMTAAYVPSQIDFDQVFGEVQSAIPEDLHDDLVLVSDAYRAFGEVLAANNNDYTNPNVQQAVQQYITEEVTEAGNNLQEYFEATCPGVA